MEQEYIESYMQMHIKKRVLAHMMTENDFKIAELEQKLSSLKSEKGRCKERLDKIESEIGSISENVYAALKSIERPELRDIIELKYMQGMTIEQISEIYQVEPRTVHRWHKKALDILSKL